MHEDKYQDIYSDNKRLPELKIMKNNLRRLRRTMKQITSKRVIAVFATSVLISNSDCFFIFRLFSNFTSVKIWQDRKT